MTFKKSKDDKEKASKSHSLKKKNNTKQFILKKGRQRSKKVTSLKTLTSKTKGNRKQ